jgi:hypothetical protein
MTGVVTTPQAELRRYGTVRIYRVAIVILLAVLAMAVGCGASPKAEPFTVESMWVCSYISSYKYVINIELRPTDNVSPDKDYVVELYRHGDLVNSQVLDWRPPAEGIPPRFETVYFPITEEDYDAFYPKGIGLEDVFSVKVRELE